MKIVFLSDLHFGHKRIPGEHIYNNLKTYAYPKLKECDVCILCGDTFHSLLDFNNPVSKYVILFINELFYLSIQYNFSIRILRGTYSHDRNQLSFIQKCAYRYTNNNKIDLKIYDTISVDSEMINNTKLDILYLPDDLHYKNEDELFDYIYTLFSEKNISKVDIVVGHGYCQYVVPFGNMVSSLVYSTHKLKSISRYGAYFGHVHTPSIYTDKDDWFIVYIGSFERMRYGEEENKGFIYTEYNNACVNTFIVNENTIPFISFTSNETDILKVISEFKLWLSNQTLSKNNVNYIRVIHTDPEVRHLLGKILQNEYTEYKCVYNSKSTDVVKITTEPIIDTNESQLVIPTEENIIDLISTYITEQKLGDINKEIIERIWNLNYEE